MFALTLISSPSHLTHHVVQAAQSLLTAMNISFDPDFHVLSEGEAIDIMLSHDLDFETMKSLRETLSPFKTDCLITPAEKRRKRLLLADMDSTIVTSETLDDMADSFGFGDKVAAITKRAMNGELDFIEAITERVAMLKGMRRDTIDGHLSSVSLTGGAKTLVQTMKAGGATCVLISGGFTIFTEHVAELCGFDHNHGNTLGTTETELTGEVIPPILDKNAKHRYLCDYTEKLGLTLNDTITTGDGANDLAMLEAAGLGIGFHPRPLLQEKLKNQVIFGDLTALLYAQGYKKSDFKP